MTASAEIPPARPSSGAALPKLAAVLPADVRANLALSEEAEQAIAGMADAESALAALEQRGLALDAIRLIAHALPRREAVWWACMCARHTAPAPPPAAALCLEAAELWVRRPADDTRRAAYARAEAAGFDSPEAWACTAAFLSGQSMSPAGQPAVPPAPHLSGLAVAGSVTLASVRERPALQPQRLGAFIASARQIAAGGTGRLEPETV
jgi:hypothetical protein